MTLPPAVEELIDFIEQHLAGGLDTWHDNLHGARQGAYSAAVTLLNAIEAGDAMLFSLLVSLSVTQSDDRQDCRRGNTACHLSFDVNAAKIAPVPGINMPAY
jgi:hypothetical protein